MSLRNKKAAVIEVFLEARQLRGAGQPNVDTESVVKFLSMESVYDFGSADNIFAASAQGSGIDNLIVK